VGHTITWLGVGGGSKSIIIEGRWGFLQSGITMEGDLDGGGLRGILNLSGCTVITETGKYPQPWTKDAHTGLK